MKVGKVVMSHPSYKLDPHPVEYEQFESLREACAVLSAEQVLALVNKQIRRHQLTLQRDRYAARHRDEIARRCQ